MIADIVFGLLLLVLLLTGLRRGFIKLVAFAGFLVSCAAGVLHLHRPLFQILSRSFKEDVAFLMAYGMIFLFAAVVFWAISRSLRRRAEKGGLGGFDAVMGGLLGFSTWAVLGCLVSLHAAARPASFLGEVMKNSRLDPFFRLGARRALDNLPPETRRKIEPKPPADPKAAPAVPKKTSPK